MCGYISYITLIQYHMTITQHSHFWLDKDLFADQDTDVTGKVKPQHDLATIARYAAVRRAIANFVSILSGKNIPVEFSSGKESYTDGERVVISAENDPSKFDVMVGLALHEASHVLLTDFSFVKLIAEHRKIRDRYAAYAHDGGTLYPIAWNGVQSEAAKQATIAGKTPEYEFTYDVARELFPENIVALWPEVTAGGGASAAVKYYRTVSQAFDDVHVLMNILEDRRIDKWVYNRAGGYRPYYDALYGKYFFTKEIGKNLKFNPAWRELTIENYLNRLLYAFHPDASPDALPGLAAMIDYMDLATIERVGEDMHDEQAGWKKQATYDAAPRLWKDACHLYGMILKVVGLAELQQREQPSQPQDIAGNGTGQNHPMLEGMNADTLQGLPDLDLPAGTLLPSPVEKDVKGKGKNKVEVDGKYNADKAKRELAEAKKLMGGEVKKKKMTRQLKASVTALEEADGEMIDIQGYGIPSGKCFVTRKLTERLMKEPWFIFSSPWASNSTLAAIAAGKRMGQILHQRLQVRNDPLFTKQTRLQGGHIDRRLLAQLGMDITTVFHKVRVDQHKPAMLHVSLDASGSMTGQKWNKVTTVAIALAYLGSKMRNIDTVISIRGGSGLPLVAILFDSRRDNFNKFCKLFAQIAPAGATPEGLCYKATMGLITECADTHQVYFINFSDGEPSFYMSEGSDLTKHGATYNGVNYVGEFAFKHTRQMVQLMREAGVKILSYFISDYGRPDVRNAAFRTMYGDDASFVNVKNVGEVLVTLNKLLRERGT